MSKMYENHQDVAGKDRNSTLLAKTLNETTFFAVGSQEYHKWMGVHYKMAFLLLKEEIYSELADKHMFCVEDVNYHNGDTHHWDIFINLQ